MGLSYSTCGRVFSRAEDPQLEPGFSDKLGVLLNLVQTGGSASGQFTLLSEFYHRF